MKPRLTVIMIIAQGRERAANWMFLIQTETLDPLRIFSKLIPAKPERTQATKMAVNPMMGFP